MPLILDANSLSQLSSNCIRFDHARIQFSNFLISQEFGFANIGACEEIWSSHCLSGASVLWRKLPF